MTDKQHPEALRLADELDAVPETGADPQTIQDAAAELRRQHAESEMRRTALLDEMQKAARQHAENETLRAKIKAYEDLDEAASDVQLLRMGYAAARLEIESLQARIKTMAEEHADELMVAHLDVRMLGRSTEPTVEYPLLPEHVGKVEVSTTLENSGLRRHKASPAYTPDQRRAYVDRAVRAEQPAGAQQPTQAQAGAVPLTDEQIEAARIEVFKVHGADLIPAVATTLARAIEAAHGIKGGQHGTE